MSSAKGLILDAIGRFALKEATVRDVVEASEHVRIVTLEGSDLRNASWTPGDKIQVLLPSRDVRTYTPSRWAKDIGVAELVVYLHGEAPGARWGRTLRQSERIRFVGPQRSLSRDVRRAAVVFGDETALGLVRALANAAPDKPLAAVIEATAPGEIETARPWLGEHGATIELVKRSATDSHLVECATSLLARLDEHADAELILAGRAQSIQAIKTRLRRLGIARRSSSKPYWSVGKTGLD